MSDNVKKLLESPVTNEIFAKCIRVANKVSQGSSSISSRLFLLIFEEIDEKLDTGAKMLV